MNIPPQVLEAVEKALLAEVEAYKAGIATDVAKFDYQITQDTYEVCKTREKQADQESSRAMKVLENVIRQHALDFVDANHD